MKIANKSWRKPIFVKIVLGTCFELNLWSFHQFSGYIIFWSQDRLSMISLKILLFYDPIIDIWAAITFVVSSK